MAGASGKKIVLVLYGSAVLLCLGLLWVGKMAASKTPGKDGIPTMEAMAALRAMPADWTRITFVQGQGWVIFVPCHRTQAAALHFEISEENPHIACDLCDSIKESRILGFASDGLGGTPPPGVQRFDVNPGESIIVETVDAKVLARFEGAPLKDYLLTWKVSKDKALYFVPSEQAAGFDTLKAEDEGAEGCLGAY